MEIDMLSQDEIIELNEKEKLISCENLDIDLNILENLPTSEFEQDENSQTGYLELHIGEIHLPDDKEESKSYEKIIIKPNDIVRVKTLQTYNFPTNICGSCIPPMSYTLNELLILDIDHVDPGYKGKLCFTILNIGNEDKEIKVFDLLAIMFLYRISQSIEE